MPKPSYSTLQVIRRLTALGWNFKWIFTLCVIISLLLAFVAGYRPVLTKIAIDEDIIEHKDLQMLLNTLMWIGLFILLEAVLQLILNYYSNFIAQGSIKNLREKLFKKMIHFKMSYFDRTPNGILVTRSVSDIETISVFYTDGILMMFGDLLRIVSVLYFMFAMSWQLSLITMLIFPIMLVITRKFQQSLKVAFTDERNQAAALNSHLQENLSGMMIVQLFNRQKASYDSFYSINEKLKHAHLRTVFIFSVFFPVVEIISTLCVGLLIVYAGFSIGKDASLSPGIFAAFISFINMLMRPLRQIADRFNSIQRGIVGAERVFRILDMHAATPNQGTIVKDSIQGKIEFKNVKFSYNENEPVIQGVSFVASPGEKIAIVGATGSGKTTLISLLARFYDAQQGEILLDDIPVKDYELHHLRNHLAVVLQDVFLFDDTIAENVRFGRKNISRKDIELAVKDTGLEEFIEQLPEGLDFRVRERGAALSQGQKQLVAFLRAYLHNPSVLILDEATSHVDTFTEQLIQRATEKLSSGRTSIIIAHRLSTIQHADKILVMSKGKIIEQGTHEELLQKKGYYHTLYSIQFQ